MGELDGMALAAVLKKYPDTPNVVFISTDREMAMQGYRVDAKRYLPKPLDPELLREALLHCYEDTRRQLKSRNQLMLPTATGHIPRIPAGHPLGGDLGPGDPHFPPHGTA